MATKKGPGTSGAFNAVKLLLLSEESAEEALLGLLDLSLCLLFDLSVLAAKSAAAAEALASSASTLVLAAAAAAAAALAAAMAFS